MKIILAFDSFKGSLTSLEVADSFEKALQIYLPHCNIHKVCIADGGEGTVDALVENLEGEYIEIPVCDPLGRTITARYGYIEKSRTAVIEMAAASGLPLLQPHEYNPLKTSTYGTGEMIAHALRLGCCNFLIGIGGSATNDGGMGMLSALGYKFLDKEGNILPCNGEMLSKIVHIDSSQAMSQLQHATFTVACDVNNPLYGPNGAAHIFAPQKGADSKMVELLDNGLRNYARVINSYKGGNIDTVPGSGAAGGLGAGFKAILNARLVRGIEMVLDAIDFDRLIADSTWVITGEGCIDRQTLMGKAPAGILHRAHSRGIKTIAIGGKVEWCDELRHSHFTAIHAITPPDMPLDVALQPSVARNNIMRTAEYLAQTLLQK